MEGRKKTKKTTYIEHTVLRQTVEVASEILADGNFNKHSLEEILETLRSVLERGNRTHHVVRKQSEGVALLHKLLLGNGRVGKAELQDQDNVVDHELITSPLEGESSRT